MEDLDTGLLLQKQNIVLWRQWFRQMTKLLGIKVFYEAPNQDMKTYNGYGELETQYHKPYPTMIIFDEHPNQKTMRKLGWNTEIADGNVVIHVAYDLPGIQAGGIFHIPSGLDNSEVRRFQVLRMSNIAVYPASISCELAPVFDNTSDITPLVDFKTSDFNLLANPEEE